MLKDKSKTELKVGIMVVIGLIVFLWVLSWAKNFSLTSTDKILRVKFANVSGLEIGDYVTVNGVRKGFVEDFKVQGENVIVTISINKEVELKEDAQFAVTMLDLMGGKKIEVLPGTSSASLDFNQVQNGTFQADIPAVMSMIGKIEGDLFNSMEDLKITLKSLNDYLTDEELNRNVKSSLSNLNELTTKINLMLDENRTGIKILTDNAAELTSEAREFISANKEGINTSVNDLQIILKRTDSLLISMNNFAAKISDEENNLNKVLNDKELYNNLIESVKHLNQLSEILLEQLQNEGIKVDADINLF